RGAAHEHVVVGDAGDELEQRDVVAHLPGGVGGEPGAPGGPAPGEVDHAGVAPAGDLVELAADDEVVLRAGAVDDDDLADVLPELLEQRPHRGDADPGGEQGHPVAA